MTATDKRKRGGGESKANMRMGEMKRRKVEGEGDEVERERGKGGGGVREKDEVMEKGSGKESNGKGEFDGEKMVKEIDGGRGDGRKNIRERD